MIWKRPLRSCSASSPTYWRARRMAPLGVLWQCQARWSTRPHRAKYTDRNAHKIKLIVSLQNVKTVHMPFALAVTCQGCRKRPHLDHVCEWNGWRWWSYQPLFFASPRLQMQGSSLSQSFQSWCHESLVTAPTDHHRYRRQMWRHSHLKWSFLCRINSPIHWLCTKFSRSSQPRSQDTDSCGNVAPPSYPTQALCFNLLHEVDQMLEPSYLVPADHFLGRLTRPIFRLILRFMGLCLKKKIAYWLGHSRLRPRQMSRNGGKLGNS